MQSLRSFLTRKCKQKKMITFSLKAENLLSKVCPGGHKHQFLLVLIFLKSAIRAQLTAGINTEIQL